MFQHPVDKPNQERMSKKVCNTVNIKLLTGTLPVALIGMNIEHCSLNSDESWPSSECWLPFFNFQDPYFHWIVMNRDQLQYVDFHSQFLGSLFSVFWLNSLQECIVYSVCNLQTMRKLVSLTIREAYPCFNPGKPGVNTRGEYFSEKPIFLHTPKNGPARESRDTLSLDSIISARSPKKAIFLHIIAIYLHGSQKKVISMHNRIWNSPNLHNITYFNVLPTFSWFKGSFE